MKKLIIIISVFFFAIAMNAQDYSVSLGNRASNVSFTGLASDTIHNTDSWAYEWNMAAKDKLQGYSLLVKLDSIRGTNAGTCVLAGSRDGTTYATITTHTHTGFATDTTYLFTDVATGTFYRYLRITLSGTGTGTTQINKIYGKIGDM